MPRRLLALLSALVVVFLGLWVISRRPEILMIPFGLLAIRTLLNTRFVDRSRR